MNFEEKIALGVFFGGESSEHEISCISASGVLSNLNPEHYTVFPVGITREGLWWLYTGEVSNIADGSWETDEAHLVPVVLSPCKAHRGLVLFDKKAGTYRVQKLDCIFPVMHGETCEDGKLQGLLAFSGVPYVGCATRAAAVSMDKISTKLLLSAFDIPQAKWHLSYRCDILADAERAADAVEGALSYPVFVKPAGTGSSRGVNRAADRAELLFALKAAAEFDEKVLVEEEVRGSEVEVAVLERFSEARGVELVAATPGEIVPDGEFYDYDAKYVKGTSLCRVPAEISDSVKGRVQTLAKKIFTALECEGLSRVDFFVDGENVVFNEINTLPGFTPISMFPKMFDYEGLSYSALLDEIVLRAVKGGRK